MKIIGVQFNIVWEDKLANYARVRSLLEGTKVPTHSLIVLPELFSTGFSMKVAELREGESSETESFLASLASQFHSYVVGGLIGTGRHDRGRNECVVFDPVGHLVCRYAKLHPFTLGKESQHYSAGEEILTFDWEGITVSPFICYDLRFPEIFRIAALRGAQLFTVIANWPVKREAHWITLLQARAIENQTYVAGINRSGSDPNYVYPGRTIIVDPHGEILADGGKEEGIVAADIDVEKVVSWRREFPALGDMRKHFLADPAPPAS